MRVAQQGGAACGASEVLSALDGSWGHRGAGGAVRRGGGGERGRCRRWPADATARLPDRASVAAGRSAGDGEAGGRGAKLLIGSGIAESACGNLVAARFKRGGMRWSKAGANDILALCACVRSGLYDDY